MADRGERAQRHRGDSDEHDDLLPLRGHAGKRHHRGAYEHGDARHFGCGGEKCSNRRRRALVDIGRPHVKRDGGNFEAEAGEQKHDAEDQSDAALPRRMRDAGKAHGAGKPIDERSAVEQHAGRQRTEHKIF